MRRLRPYTNSLRRRVFGSYRLEDLASQVEELAPEYTGQFDALIALPDEGGRVTATIARHNLDMHLRYFAPQKVVHHAVRRYELNDVLVAFNGVFARGATFNRFGALDRRALLRDPITPLAQASYCLEDRSYFFFGHWMRSFAQCLLADSASPLLHFAPKNWDHAPHYETLFDLKSQPAGLYHVEKMTLFQDYAQTDHKAKRYDILRARLQGAVPPAPGAKPYVYLKRGQTGAARLVANEDALERQLEQMGFDIIDLATTPLDQIHARAVGADIAMTIEGSHADHLHWLIRPGGTLWVLNPADHFNTSQFAVAQTMGNKTACSVITPSPDGYQVDLTRLNRTFDLVLRA